MKSINTLLEMGLIAVESSSYFDKRGMKWTGGNLYAGTQKELTAKLRQNIDIYQGIDLTEQSRMTLAEWLEQWLGQISTTLRPSTLEHYRRDIENHVAHYLGKKILTQVTAADLRKRYDSLKKNGRVKPRPGQSCGLMWTDFDGRAGTLHICRTLHREKGGRLAAGDPKTYAGTRKIVLPPSTAELLRTRKKKSFSPWIFHDPLRPETPVNPSAACHQLRKLLAQAGLTNIRFHDLRHTFSTVSLEHGTDIKTLSTIIGHVSSSTTLNVYAHITDGMRRTAAQGWHRLCYPDQ